MNDASTGQIGDAQVSNGQSLDGQAGDPQPDDTAKPDLWHYKDERSGKRAGPVDRSAIAELIAAHRIDRATLVWHPALTEWTKAGQSDLVGLFGTEPPPLPAGEINRGAAYLLALVPLWGTVVQAVGSVAYANRSGLSPSDVYDHRAWFIPFMVFNGILASWDEHNLRKVGLRLRGAAVFGALLAPFYLFASCRTVSRHSGRGAWSAYIPVVLWVLAFAGMLVVDTLMFDPDAPALFNPDQWF